MGQGKKIKCKCKERELAWGVGMFYPDVCQETLDDIKNGKYGKEMKELVDKTELATVDASDKVYWCEKCGHMESSLCLDLYKGDDVSLKKYVHICPVCKAAMKEIDEEEIENMRCPKCGEIYKETAFFDWD